MRTIGLGGLPIATKDPEEIAARLLVLIFFIAPPLFATIETSPTAWGIIAPICGAGLFASVTRPAKALIAPALTLCALSAFVICSSFWAIDPKRPLLAFRDLFGYSIAALFLFHWLLVIPEPACTRILKAFLGGAVIAIFIIVARELGMAWSGSNGMARTVQAITLHKITFYGILFAILLLTLRRPLYTVTAGIFGICTLVFGRSTGVSIAIIFVTLFFFLSETRQRFTFNAIVTIYIIVAFLAPIIAPVLFSYLDQIGLLNFYPGTFSARLEIWKMVSTHVQNAPILGHGANTIRNATWLISDAKFYVDQDLPSAHNIVMDLWFELGIIGVATFGVLLGAIAKLISNLRGPSYFLCASFFIAVLIELSVDHRIWLSWVLGTLIMSVAVCILFYRSTRAGATR